MGIKGVIYGSYIHIAIEPSINRHQRELKGMDERFQPVNLHLKSIASFSVKFLLYLSANRQLSNASDLN